MAHVIISKTIKDLIAAYAQSLPRTPRDVWMEARRPLTEFTGAKVDTIREWFSGFHPPTGMYLVRIRYFLEAAGFQVKELDNLPRPVYALGKTVACGALDVEVAASALGHTTTHHLYKAFHGIYRPSLAVLGRMKDIAEKHRAETERRMKELARMLDKSPDAAEPRTIPPILRPERAPTTAGDRELVIHALAGLVNAMLPLATRLVSDSFSAEDRKALHALTGESNIFKLSNALSRLCSETARKNIAAHTATSQKQGDR